MEAQPGAPPIVILPGFGNCSEDYTAPFGNEEAAVAAALRVSFGCVCPSVGICAPRSGLHLAPFSTLLLLPAPCSLLTMQRRGFSVYVVPVLRKDWFKVARALLTRAFWTSSCTTHPGYSW